MVKARQHLAQRPPRAKLALKLLLPRQEENAAHAEFLYLLGQCLERLRRFSQAFDVLQQAHNLDPTNPAYLYDMGSCRFNQAMYRESLHIWRELESLEARIPHQGQRARISFNRGACAKELEFISEAIEAFTRAVSLAEDKRNREHYLYELAGLHLNHHRYDAAAEEFATLKRLGPGRWEYPFYLGVAQLGQGKLDDAEANLLDARRLGPKEARIPLKLGNLYMRRNMEDHAEGYYMEALEKNPMADEPMRKLMMISRKRGDTEVAAEYSKRYRTIEAQSTANGSRSSSSTTGARMPASPSPTCSPIFPTTTGAS
jgi:tetratricopeptide (TPR) repeat protein